MNGSTSPPEAPLSQADPEERLAVICREIVNVHHEVSNPLAVISGNAQLLMEIMRAMEVDEELRGPIADIDEASRMLAASLRRLSALREQIRQYDLGDNP